MIINSPQNVAMSLKTGLTIGLRTLRLSRTSKTCHSLSPLLQRSHDFHGRLHSTNTQTTYSSVDPTEVSHFNALASSWWDPHGPSRILHLMNPIRHSFVSKCLASSAQPAVSSTSKLHFLDIGCGGGIFAESAARLPNVATVTAIDPSSEVLKIADAHRKQDPMLLAKDKLTYLNTDIDSLDLQRRPDGYDVVSVFEVIEHVPKPSSFLKTVMPFVKPGGWLVMSTIARTWTSWAVTKLVAEDIMGVVPRGTHDWNKYINEAELREWFGKQEGWESPKAMGVMYIPGFGWKEVVGGEDIGNYFFAIRKSPVSK